MSVKSILELFIRESLPPEDLEAVDDCKDFILEWEEEVVYALSQEFPGIDKYSLREIWRTGVDSFLRISMEETETP